MPHGDHRSAIHASPTGALWAVTGVLAAVLLLVATVVLVDTPSASRAPADAPMPTAPPAIRYLVLISPLTPDRQP